MNIGTSFIICGLVFIFLLFIVYFIKDKIKSEETKLYGDLLKTTLLGTIVAIPTYYVCLYPDFNSILSFIITKLYLVYLVTWINFFTLYIIYISLPKLYIKFRKIFMISWFIEVLIISILKIYYHNANYQVYSYGPSVNATYFMALIYIIIWIVCIFSNIKNINNKKYIPIFSIILFGLICVIIQNINPAFRLMTFVLVLVTFIMYFTIENPDAKMIQQLEIAKDQADKANKAKSDFLSSMSHEIRTPLNAIIGFSDCIIQSNTLDDAKENAKDVIGASKTLLEIVNGILDISKIESGKIDIICKDYNVRKMINEIVKLIHGRIGDKPIDFQVYIAPDLPVTLYGDSFNIKKVLINLLTNAVKYTDQGYVKFDIKCVNKDGICRLIISVKDSGRGIKKEDIDKLFTKFQRLDEEKNQTIEGTGLGLAITKQLIEMMNGSIVVSSEYGVGSTFTVALDQKISNKNILENTTELEQIIDLSNKNILVVDDNKLNLKVASKLISRYNANVILCNSGGECINLINNGNKYDLILLDDMMPGLSGVETLKKLKYINNFKIPTIALTANAINGMKEKYLNDGFDGYLAKPIDKNELYTILKRFLVKNNNQINNIKQSISNINNSLDKNIIYSDYSNKNILIVDDNNINIKVESKLMSNYKFNIETANSGIEAINKVKSKKYDLIFMDIMMPMMDGIKTLNELHKFPNLNTPVIALTADAVIGSKEKYLNDGFDGYLAKPVNKMELDKIIHEKLDK